MLDRHLVIHPNVFPAGAGVIPSSAKNSSAVMRVPRRCGGDPISKEGWEACDECSPQVRG